MEEQGEEEKHLINLQELKELRARDSEKAKGRRRSMNSLFLKEGILKKGCRRD